MSSWQVCFLPWWHIKIKRKRDGSHDAVVTALQAGYRHLDTAHGYFNEAGVGQGIIDSGIPREEIWVTSKLWPSEFPGSTNPDHILENIEIFDFELTDEEMEQIRALDKGEEGRYFNISYEQMGGFFTSLNE